MKSSVFSFELLVGMPRGPSAVTEYDSISMPLVGTALGVRFPSIESGLPAAIDRMPQFRCGGSPLLLIDVRLNVEVEC